MSERVRIVVDTAEQRGAVYRVLTDLPEVDVELSRLPIGDYLLGGGFAVERKTVDDFAASIADRRLFAQIAALKDAYERPVILLEGTLAAVRTRMHPNALRGALSYLVAIAGLSVLPAANGEESALLLVQLARHVQHGLRRPPDPMPKRAASGLAAQQERLIAALPDVGPTLARQLLAHFGTPEVILLAAEPDLRAVPGIGPARAAAIRRTLSGAYAPDDDSQVGVPAGVGWLVPPTLGVDQRRARSEVGEDNDHGT